MLLDTRSMSFDMREIDNRRFMFSPQAGELILGRQYRGGQLYKSHAEEHFDSGAKAPFDSFIRGWIGTGRDYPDGVIHFAPNIGTDNIPAFDNAFSTLQMFSENGAALTILTAVLIAAVVAWLSIRPEEQPKAVRAGLWLMAGGGLGNLYDRLVYGSVIDFIDPIFVRFAVFNPADAFICVGAALAFVALLRDERRRARDAAGE